MAARAQVAPLEVTRVVAGGSHVTVPLARTYTNPVVVCSATYATNSTPVVVRVSQVTSASFAVRLQNPSDGPVSAETVSCLVVEQGVWNVSGAETLDRGAFARLVAANFGLDQALVQPKTTAEMAQKAKRPLSENQLVT